MGSKAAGYKQVALNAAFIRGFGAVWSDLYEAYEIDCGQFTVWAVEHDNNVWWLSNEPPHYMTGVPSDICTTRKDFLLCVYYYGCQAGIKEAQREVREALGLNH